MVAKFIGILSLCQVYLKPSIPTIYATKEASDTREECVIRLWHTIVDEMIGDASVFLNYTLNNLDSKLCAKFETENDDDEETETDDEENEDRKNEENDQEIRLRLKKIELTENELRDVMYASLSEDHYYEIQMISVSF